MASVASSFNQIFVLSKGFLSYFGISSWILSQGTEILKTSTIQSATSMGTMNSGSMSSMVGGSMIQGTSTHGYTHSFGWLYMTVMGLFLTWGIGNNLLYMWMLSGKFPH